MPSLFSLGVIIVTLVVTAVASLWKTRHEGDDHVPDHATAAREPGDVDDTPGPDWR
ncbi:hypothetical protein [Nocardioides convexus]|uniref:hypothetical protein n=1 Tax=Nocardioides convexus TaxID=2712224 RepID=UPI003101AA9C